MDSSAVASHPEPSPRLAPGPPPPAHTTQVDQATHERLVRDLKRMRLRVDELLKENEGLRASLWEVSWRWGRASGKGKARGKEVEGFATPTTPAIEPITPAKTSTEYAPPPRSSSPFATATPSSFMRLNEPIVPLPAPAQLPDTPASIAAALFHSHIPPRPHSPSSTSSRATPALRDASLKRDLDISLPRSRTHRTEERESWRWGRGYDLKGHRGAVYALKFSETACQGKGRILASAGFDGIRLWGSKEGPRDSNEEEGDAWDDGDVEEIAHLKSHEGPVSDVAFDATTNHLLSGGYDSQIFVFPLSTPASSPNSEPFAPIWSLKTSGLVQTVAWVHPHAEMGSENQKLFTWGTSGNELGIGDLRMVAPVCVVQHDAMVNSIQSIHRSPHLLVGDSQGQMRHFSLRTMSFLPLPETASTSTTPSLASLLHSTPSTVAPAPKKGTSISGLALTPDWGRKGDARWLATTSFDNLVRVFDSSDALKMGPKLVQSLKGKNKNWPIKSAWFQGRDYMDSVSASKRRPVNRSRSTSFSDTRPSPRFQATSSDSDDNTSDSSPDIRPLASSLLLAAGSSDPVVLLFDLSAPAPSSLGASTTDATTLVQRLEGHKESVYAVDFLMPNLGVAGGGGYEGKGLLASAGGDWIVKVWKPIFADVE